MNARGWLITSLALSSAWWMAGCTMLEAGSSGSRSQSQMQYDYLEERVRVLTDRVTQLEQANASLQREVSDLQIKLNQAQGGASAQDLQSLREKVIQLEVQREKDKQAILDQLAREISGIARSSRPSSSGSGGSGSDVGYEHKVEAGQTLYDIAKAYNTTVTAIKKANNLSGDTIRVGQVLFIPKPR